MQESKKRKGVWASVIAAVGLVGYLIYQFSGISMILNLKSCQNIEQKVSQGDVNVNIRNEMPDNNGENIEPREDAKEKGDEKIAKEFQPEIQQKERQADYNGKPHLSDNLQVFVSEIGKNEDDLTISLRIKNVTSKKIYIAVDEGNGFTTMGGNKGTKCVLHSDGVSGISHFRINQRFIKKRINDFTWLGANQETVVSFFFHSKKWKPIPDNIFTFSSSFLFYNDGNTFYESVGISGIQVD